jgi:hypothetical protein
MFYNLMRKSSIITSVIIDDDTGQIIKRGKILDKDQFPLQGQAHNYSLTEWWRDRAVPMTQGNIAQMLKQSELSNSLVYLTKNLGLSLTDYYWIRPLGSGLTWEQVNLFDNDFKENLLLGTIELPDGEHAFNYQPNSSLQGNVEKTWVIDSGIRKMVKGNHTELSSESINEVIISSAIGAQGFPHAEYALTEIEGKSYDYGCISLLFTSQELELVSAYAVMQSEIQPNGVSGFEHFIRVCGQHGLDKNYVHRFLDFEICMDFIFTNRDRHLTNIAILRDADTLEFASMAPIFDNGKSMFVGRELCPVTDKQMLSQEVTSFCDTELKLLKLVQDRNLVDISKLPSTDDIRKLYEMDSRVSEDRIRFVLESYERKVDLYDRFSRGQSLTAIKFGMNTGQGNPVPGEDDSEEEDILRA